MLHVSKQLVAISLLSASSLALSMYKQSMHPMHQDIMIQRVQAIDNPTKAAFLCKKNTLVIGGKDGISEVNWKQDKKIADIIPSGHAHSFVINQQRNAVAALDIFYDKMNDQAAGKVVLYDTEKQKVTWESSFKEKKPSFVFTHSNTLYVFQKDGTVRSSNNNKSHRLLQAKKIHNGAIAADGKEEEIIFSNEYHMNSSCSELHTLRFDQKSFSSIQYAALNNDKDTAKIYAHSPLNKIVALHYDRNNMWMLFDRASKILIQTDTHLEGCYALAFHPKNESLLATITKDGFIEIYDFYKNKILAKTYNPLWIFTANALSKHTSIDFSEDGENLAVTIGIEGGAGKDRTYDYRCFVLSNLYPKNIN